MTIREIVEMELQANTATDEEIALRFGLNMPSVRRTRRQLVIEGRVKQVDTFYPWGRAPQAVWGLTTLPESTPAPADVF